MTDPGTTKPTSADVFTRIFNENAWKNADSVSGPGSVLSMTALVRAGLAEFFEEEKVRVLVDAPCGDGNWISTITQGLDLYLGFDVVEPLILGNIARHRRTNHFFQVADITTSVLPRADAILCRDCLVHLPLTMAMEAIANFKASQSTYLISTTFLERADNPDKGLGGWRPLNLTRPPFNFPEPFKIIRELDKPGYQYNDKSLGVWRLDQIDL